MATIIERKGVNGTTFRAVIRLAGQPTITKTFDKKIKATQWAAEKEKTTRSRAVYASAHTLGDLMTRYAVDVEQTKDYVNRSAQVWFTRYATVWADVSLSKCDEDWWFDELRDMKLSPGSRGLYAARARQALNYARHHLKFACDIEGLAKAIKSLSLPPLRLIRPSNERERLIEPDEVDAIKAQFAGINHRLSQRMPDIIDFALALGMRCGEICRITWADLDVRRGALIIRARKHPTDKMRNDGKLPALVNNAIEIMKRQPRLMLKDGELDPRIFPFSSNSVSMVFTRAVRRAGIKDARFHDLRHTAISGLFDQGFQIEEVAKVSGHHNWKHLERYTHIDSLRLNDGPISQQRQRRAAA